MEAVVQKSLTHLTILEELDNQLAHYHQNHHLWRMRAMGIIDALTTLFLGTPVLDEDRKAVSSRIQKLSSNVKVAVAELEVNERREEVQNGKRWNPLSEMLKHCEVK
jgi:hypothetical protein